MPKTTVKIECSQEQLDVIEDHLLFGKELGVLPDERAWMRAKIAKKLGKSNFKMIGANLDIENGEWSVEIQEV